MIPLLTPVIFRETVPLKAARISAFQVTGAFLEVVPLSELVKGFRIRATAGMKRWKKVIVPKECLQVLYVERLRVLLPLGGTAGASGQMVCAR